jgi:hypothetical protein
MMFGSESVRGQLWEWLAEPPVYGMSQMNAIHYLCDQERSAPTRRVFREPHMHQMSVVQYMTRCRQQGGVRSNDQDKAKVIAHLKRNNEVDWLKKWEVVNGDGSLGQDPKGLVVSIPLVIQYHVDNVRAYNEEILTAINWYNEIGGVPTYDQMHVLGFGLITLLLGWRHEPTYSYLTSGTYLCMLYSYNSLVISYAYYKAVP